jgi:hypothetical protein
MASELAIAAVARTLLRLLEEQCPRSEFSGTPRFVLLAGPDQGDTPVTEGFTLLLWRVTVNGTQRNQLPRRAADGSLRRPPLPVDLHFLLTPWAVEAERQLRLTGWTLRFMEDHSVLPAALLNQSLTRRERAAFEPDEAVELFFDAPSLPDYLGLWDKFRSRWQTGLTYGVRMVRLESPLMLQEAGRVRTRELRAGAAVTVAEAATTGTGPQP